MDIYQIYFKICKGLKSAIDSTIKREIISTMKSAINRSKIKENILEVISKAGRPISTDEIASGLGVSWHTAIRHCLDLELQGKLFKFVIGRICAWQIKNG